MFSINKLTKKKTMDLFVVIFGEALLFVQNKLIKLSGTYNHDVYNKMKPEIYYGILELFMIWFWGYILIILENKSEYVQNDLIKALGKNFNYRDELLSLLSINRDSFERGVAPNEDNLGIKVDVLSKVYHTNVFETIKSNSYKDLQTLILAGGYKIQIGKNEKMIFDIVNLLINESVNNVNSICDTAIKKYKNLKSIEKDNYLKGLNYQIPSYLIEINENPFF